MQIHLKTAAHHIAFQAKKRGGIEMRIIADFFYYNLCSVKKLTKGRRKLIHAQARSHRNEMDKKACVECGKGKNLGKPPNNERKINPQFLFCVCVRLYDTQFTTNYYLARHWFYSAFDSIDFDSRTRPL